MVDAILGVIGTILYPLFSIIFVLIDLIQNIFRAFAGVGTIWYNEGGGTGVNANLKPIKSGEGDNLLADDNGGIVYYLLRSDLVMNLVWSIATLALILLIVFTVIAFIKNIYAPKSKSWQEIIGLSVKGLFNFIFIPVVCLLGVILGNILLNAIDGATSTGGATTISRKLFLSAAYDANVIRNQKSITYDKANEIIDMRNSYYENDIDKIKIPDNKKGSDTIEGADIEYYANLIDEAFASGEISIYEWFSVGPYYNMWGINYLTLAVGGVFILYALGSISFGMIKRLFTLIMLFIISPAACAMYPLDEGNACKQITGDFKKNTISAYGAVAGMNIFFSIAPLVQNINLDSFTFFQDIIHIILLICGLFMVKDFISMISNYFGAGNAYSDGSGMMGNVKKKLSGATKLGASAVGEFRKAAIKSSATGKARTFFGTLAKDGLGSLTNNVLKTMTGLSTEDYKKSWTGAEDNAKKEIEKAGKDAKRRASEKAEKKAFNDAVDSEFNTRMQNPEVQTEIQRRVDEAIKYNSDLAKQNDMSTPRVRTDKEYYARQVENEILSDARAAVRENRYGVHSDVFGADGKIIESRAAEHIATLKTDAEKEKLALAYAARSGGETTLEKLLGQAKTISGQKAGAAAEAISARSKVDKSTGILEATELKIKKLELQNAKLQTQISDAGDDEAKLAKIVKKYDANNAKIVQYQQELEQANKKLKENTYDLSEAFGEAMKAFKITEGNGLKEVLKYLGENFSKLQDNMQQSIKDFDLLPKNVQDLIKELDKQRKKIAETK